MISIHTEVTPHQELPRESAEISVPTSITKHGPLFRYHLKQLFQSRRRNAIAVKLVPAATPRMMAAGGFPHPVPDPSPLPLSLILLQGVTCEHSAIHGNLQQSFA